MSHDFLTDLGTEVVIAARYSPPSQHPATLPRAAELSERSEQPPAPHHSKSCSDTMAGLVCCVRCLALPSCNGTSVLWWLFWVTWEGGRGILHILRCAVFVISPCVQGASPNSHEGLLYYACLQAVQWPVTKPGEGCPL